MKINIDSLLNFNKGRQFLLSEFCVYCAKKLPITGDFNINIVSERSQYGIGTTAAYIVGENTCYIYGKNRAIPDIMRSIAHEMTHMMQDQLGLINGQIRDAGGFHEDQANSRAGELLKLFVNEKDNNKSVYEHKKY